MATRHPVSSALFIAAVLPAMTGAMSAAAVRGQSAVLIVLVSSIAGVVYHRWGK